MKKSILAMLLISSCFLQAQPPNEDEDVAYFHKSLKAGFLTTLGLFAVNAACSACGCKDPSSFCAALPELEIYIPLALGAGGTVITYYLTNPPQ